jgi:hypothetical protein
MNSAAAAATAGQAAMPQPLAGATLHARVMLSRPAYTCVTPDGMRGLELHFAKDAGGLFPEGLRARWLGEQATRFMEAHQADLRPGRALDVALYHIKSRDSETRALIAACQLAPLPPSWRKHLETTVHQEQSA